ncbi:MAG: hypothetical protein ACUVUU_06675 [bacterium]
MKVCPYLTGVWTFRCLARTGFVIPSITEETRYCLSKKFEKCPHYMRLIGISRNRASVRIVNKGEHLSN